MQTMQGEQTCVCNSIGAPSTEVRLCSRCHVYWRGDQRLTSVSTIIKAVWPIRPDYSEAPADVLENARIRGVEVDALFTAYLRGTLSKIPAGTREDVKDLLLKLVQWWDTYGWDNADGQVLLAGPTEAGTCDIRGESIIADLKCTYDIEPMYPVQLGGYADLNEAQYGRLPTTLGIIHLTKRFKQPQWIPLDVEECVRDYRLCRDVYRMAVRRSK